MGFGASTLVLGSLASAIIDGGIISWQMTFALFGVIAGIALLIGSLFLRFPKAEELQAFTVSAAASQNAPKNSLTTFEMLKTRAFWMVFIFAVFGSAIGSGVISHAKQIVLDCGVNAAIATLCVGILSVANGFGRVLFGMLYDRKGRSGAMYTAILFLVGAVVLLLFSLKAAATLPVIPGLLLVGMAYGAMPTTSAAFVAQQFGPKFQRNEPDADGFIVYFCYQQHACCKLRQLYQFLLSVSGILRRHVAYQPSAERKKSKTERLISASQKPPKHLQMFQGLIFSEYKIYCKPAISQPSLLRIWSGLSAYSRAVSGVISPA